MPTHRAPRAIVSLGLLGVALAGCQSLQTSDSFLGIITPYKVEVVQGNVVTSEQVALVKPGQTRAQVRDLLQTEGYFAPQVQVERAPGRGANQPDLVTVKVEPLPSSLSTQRRPPISFVSWSAIASPNPVPPKRRVVEASACVKASKIRACLS